MRWGPRFAGGGVSIGALGGAFVLLGTGPLLAGDGPSHLDLALVNVVQLPPTAVRMLEHEARAILVEQGAQVSWGDADHHPAPGRWELRVILVGSEYPHEPRQAAVLGAVEPHAPRPAIWVYTRAVARVLGLRWPPEAASIGAQRTLGLAMGRVAVHEVVHVLSPDSAHATDGLMASRVGRDDLVGPRPRVDLPPPTLWRSLTAKSWDPGRPPEDGRCLLASRDTVRTRGGGS